MKNFSYLLAIAAFALCVSLSPRAGHAQCPTGQSTMQIVIQTDSQPMQTSFKVFDLSSHSLLLHLPPSSFSPNGTANFNLCVPSGHCLKADLYDAGGNGGSAFTISYQGSTHSSWASFGHITTAMMGTGSCPDLTPVLDSASYLIRSACPLQIGSNNTIIGPIMGNPQSGNVCLGSGNVIRGWIAGDAIAIGAGNTIGGHQGLHLFGKDYGSSCASSNGLPGKQFHGTDGPWGNTTNACEPEMDIPLSDNDIYLDGINASTTINPGHYGKVTVLNGAILEYNGNPGLDPDPAYYTFTELVVLGGKLRPGGGVLCDIFIGTNKVSFGQGAEVDAIINCKEMHVGDGNVINGKMTVEDENGTAIIGNNNIFRKTVCPPCENSNKNGSGSLEPEDGLQSWPNPSRTGEIRFSGPAGTIEVYDLRGQMIHRGALRPDAGQEGAAFHRMSTRGLEPGLYIGRVVTADGRVLSNRFVLQRS